MPEETSQHKLCAIMFSDIVGYSKMMGEDETETMAFLKEHNEIVRGEVAAHFGQVIKTGGDSFLVSFNSAVNAVRCALGIQNSIDKYNQGSRKKRLLRIGIHIGEIIFQDNDIFGDGVNVAARLQPIADPGGICISQDVYNFVKNKVDIKVVPLGPQELKNIAQKIEVYKVVMDTFSGTIPFRMKMTWKRLFARKLFRYAVIILAITGCYLWWNHYGPKAKSANSGKEDLSATHSSSKTSASISKTKTTRKNPNVVDFFNPKDTSYIDINGYGIPKQKKPFLEPNGDLVFIFDSGSAWGCGFEIYSNVQPLLHRGEKDLHGCEFIRFELLAPAGLKCAVHLHESGAGPVEQTSFDAAAGADGEQYIYDGLSGDGSWKNWKIKLSDFSVSPYYGNQKGNRKLDLQALKNVAVQIDANQGQGEVRLKNLVFLRK